MISSDIDAATDERAPAAYVFGPFRLELRSRQLLREDGSPVTLTSKVFDTLLVLVEHAGEALGKDALMAALWPGRVVEENNLNQKISTLRRALGTSGAMDRYIVTEPGRGYRFVAEVRVVYDTPMAGLHRADLEGAVEATAESPDSDETADRRGVSVSIPDVGQRRGAGGRLVRWFGIVAIAAVASVGAWQAIDRRVHVAAPDSRLNTIGAGDRLTMPNAHALLVLPLRVIGSAPEDRAFADGLGEELISVLARVDGLRVIGRESAFRARPANEDPTQTTQRLGVSHTLEGSMRHEGDQLRIALRLTDVSSGRTLWAEQYDHAARDVFALERDVANAVSAALALKLGNEVQAELAREGDPVLFRRYLEARQLGRKWPRKAAIDAFRRLVADAPDYARGHGGLALLLLRSGDPRKAEALAEANRALALDPELTDAIAALGFGACQSDDWERGLDLTRRALDHAPGDTSIRLGYGICLTALGYLPAGLAQIEQAQATDPFSVEANVVLGTALDLAGRHEMAANHYAMSENGFGLLWFNAMWRNDLVAARESTTGRQDRWSDSQRAVTEAIADSTLWPAARLALDASERSDGHPDGQRNWARMFDPQSDAALDIAALEYIRHFGLGPQGLWIWLPAMAGHRRSAAFQDYLVRTHTLDYWRAHGWPAQCRAVGDTAQCD